MRDDMKHIIIDTARRGSGYLDYRAVRRKKRRQKDTLKESYSKKGYDLRKSESDRLSPLRRMLQKNSGRKWDDVYSEICKSCDVRGIRGYHLRDHVRYMVDMNTYRDENGKVWIRAQWREYCPEDTHYGDELYVDPEGYLRHIPRKNSSRRRRNSNENLKKINGAYFARKEGIWYKLTTVPAPKLYNAQKYNWISRADYCDAILGECSRYDLRRFYNEYIYAIDKKQLNRKELRKLNLKNG